MKQQIFQACARVVGLVLGVCGVAAIVVPFILPKDPLPSGISTSYWLPGLVPLLLLASVFLRSAYLALFRWSPLALRHVVGGIFFFITLLCFFYLPSQVPGSWAGPTFLAILPICYALYRLSSNILSRSAFPTLSAATPIPASPGLFRN